MNRIAIACFVWYLCVFVPILITLEVIYDDIASNMRTMNIAIRLFRHYRPWPLQYWDQLQLLGYRPTDKITSIQSFKTFGAWNAFCHCITLLIGVCLCLCLLARKCARVRLNKNSTLISANSIACLPTRFETWYFYFMYAFSFRFLLRLFR